MHHGVTPWLYFSCGIFSSFSYPDLLLLSFTCAAVPLQVEAHCRAEKEKLLKSDVEKGKVHAGAALAGAAGSSAATQPAGMTAAAAVPSVLHPGAAMMHPGAVAPHPAAVSAAALVSDGERWGSRV